MSNPYQFTRINATYMTPEQKEFLLSKCETLEKATYIELLSQHPREEFESDTYWVSREFLYREDTQMWHVKVIRHDNQPLHDWYALQNIKNAICGPEHTGFEIYPPESALVDERNYYHLWVHVDPEYKFPFSMK